MDLSAIRFVEPPGHTETLALSLMSVAAGAGMVIDYDDLCAALGISCTAVSTTADPCPGRWTTYGRDAFVEPAARLFGLELRELQPPDVAVDMLEAEEFGQHWEYSYKPLIRRALENSQPVLAWRGWPDAFWPQWGVITAIHGEDFTGWTRGSGGKPLTLRLPALQCYVIERTESRPAPPLTSVCAMAVRHMDAYLSAAPLRPGAVDETTRVMTGPRAYAAWIAWLESDAAQTPQAVKEHCDLAEAIATGHGSAAVFFGRVGQVMSADYRSAIEAARQCCERVSELLAPSRDMALSSRLMGTIDGRGELVEALRPAAVEDQRLADRLHLLADSMPS